jgi:two-component system, NarL family, response regulator NreC
MQQIDIVIIEYHTILRESLRFVLNRGRSLRVTGEAAGIDEAEELVALLKPHVLLVDTSSREAIILQTIEILKRCHPETKIIALSDQPEDDYCQSMLQPSVDAYLPRRSAICELLRTINAVANGLGPSLQSSAAEQSPAAPVARYTDPDDLSARELQVLQLMAAGASSKVIARDLGVSYKTIYNHRANIMAKLCVHNCVQAVNRAIDLELIAANMGPISR